MERRGCSQKASTKHGESNEGNKRCFLEKVTRWGWCWHFCIKEMVLGDRKKLMWELKKTEIHSSCMMSRGRCNKDNRKWQSSKSCAASFQTDSSRYQLHLPRPAERTAQQPRHKTPSWDNKLGPADQQKTSLKRELRRSSARLRHSRRCSELQSPR